MWAVVSRFPVPVRLSHNGVYPPNMSQKTILTQTAFMEYLISAMRKNQLMHPARLSNQEADGQSHSREDHIYSSELLVTTLRTPVILLSPSSERLSTSPDKTLTQILNDHITKVVQAIKRTCLPLLQLLMIETFFARDWRAAETTSSCTPLSC